MNKKVFLFLAALILALHPRVSHADPSKAEDEAYKMAVRYTQLGFAMSPTNHTGLGGTGHTVRFLIPVSKGLDYLFLVGGDVAAQNIDIYVYDEVGSLILDDRRPDRRAGVKFRSSYNGTTQVYVHMARAEGLAAYSVLVGRRGGDRGNPEIPGGPNADAVNK